MVLIVAYLVGQGMFLILGLSSASGERLWRDSTQWDDFSEDGLRDAELYVNYSSFYLLHRDVVVNEDVKWLFSGEIRLLDHSENESRRLRFYYYNVSYGYMSHPFYYDYEGADDQNRFAVRFNHITRFYRPGDYILRVDDLLLDSNITFEGRGRILVYDETFRMIEDFQDTNLGVLEVILGLVILTLLVSAWIQFAFVVSWVDLKWEWRMFWKSAYADVFSFFLLMFSFDIFTTLVGLSYGAWEMNDFYRVDMLGGIWFSVLVILGIGFFAFYHSDRGTFHLRGISFAPSFLVYLAGFGAAGLLRIQIVDSNLNVLRLLAGHEVYQLALIAIIGCAVIFSIWILIRVLRRRQKRKSFA